MDNYKLVLLDIDGTLCDRDSVEIYPAALRFISALGAGVDVVFITNQGGPPCRRAGWDFGHTFPTQMKVQTRLDNLMKQIYDLRDMRPSLYVAWIYQDNSGNVFDLAGVVIDESDKKRALYWRKPGPGMILQACLDSSTRPADVLVVGDRTEDADAARAAGVAFRWAEEI